MTPLFEFWGFSFTLHAAGALLASLSILLLGAYITIIQPRTQGSVQFLVLMTAASIWMGANGMMRAAPDPITARTWWKASYLGIGALPAALFGFSLWLAGRPDSRSGTLSLLWVGALVLQVIVVGTGWPSAGMELHDWGYFADYLPSGAVIIPIVVGAVCLSIWELRGPKSPGDPERLALRKAFLITAALCLLGVSLFDFAPALGSGTPPLGYIVIMAATAALFVVFTRYRLVNLTPATTAKSTLDAVTDAVAVCDMMGRIRVANRALHTLVGFEQSHLVGSLIQDSVAVGEDRDELVKLIVVDDPGERRMKVFPASGDPVPTVVSAHPLEDPPGNRVGSVVIIRDLTDQIFFEERLTRSERLRAMGNLAGGVAHDFNNILMAVQGYAAILQEELGSQPISSQVRKGLAEIVKGTERATSLTKQLLTFGSTDVVEGKVHDVRAILEACGPIIDRLIPGNVDLRVLVPPVPAMAIVDPARMEQVIVNLALNGRDAMPEGGVLRIEAQVAAAGAAPESLELEEGWYVAVRVSDTGSGMSPEVAARAFEPFFTTRPDAGGMGLSTVYGIVTQAGGRVDLETEPGEGTTVTVYVPWHAADSPEDSPELDKPAGVAPESAAVVLIAEDNDAVRALTSTVMRRAGYTVHAAEDGLKAYQIAESLEFKLDLLITDLIMPEVGGRELHQKLVDQLPDLVTLFMSGHPGDPLDLSKIGGLRSIFLQKPFPPKALVDSAEDLLAGVSTP